MNPVFISYVHDNKEIVDSLYADLNKQNINVWLDRKDIEPGAFWEDAIRRAISNGAFFIPCFSVEYKDRNSTHMNEELIIAIEELRKRQIDRSWFIPVLLSGEVPDRAIGAGRTLRSLQRLNLNDDCWDDTIQRLLRLIKPERLPYITKLNFEPVCIKRGETISLSFNINYEGTEPLEKIMLGASIMSDLTGKEISNTDEDKLVNLQVGSNICSRNLTVPLDAQSGRYYVLGAIWQDRLGKMIDRINLGIVLDVQD